MKYIHVSPRENEVASLFAQGLVRKEVAERMGISSRTVETFTSRIFDRMEDAGEQRSKTRMAVLFVSGRFREGRA